MKETVFISFFNYKNNKNWQKKTINKKLNNIMKKEKCFNAIVKE